jgi:hypothetical protein
MTRSIATWVGIAAICLVILFIPIWQDAQTVAEATHRSGLSSFVELGSREYPADYVPSNDKDCIGDFSTRRRAQRFFVEHGGPGKDPHNLDFDGDGKACEQFEY